MRVATVVGNRPQFVKASVVSRRLRERATEILIHTGQHYDDDLSQVFFDELDLPAPDHRLELGTGSNTQQTARMLVALEPLLDDLAPDVVLVYGDTNSTLAGALCAAQQGFPIAHVEAGMRSFDHRMPEELNRVLTDDCSDLLFCSTQTAIRNLEREHARGERHLVGDVMADLALATLPIAAQRSDALDRFDLEPGSYLLVTAHRAGTVDDPERLEALVELLGALPAPALFPVHPRTRTKLEAAGRIDWLAASGLKLTAPLGYLDMIRLTASARAVLTDSGG
nr:UDP-N-acetylglucosamine 2-epimerase (non-hydrolyzing) [Thermoleophilaceae bacterium]